MARYNTSLDTNVVTGATTISSPNFGNFTQLTGTAPYTVIIPNPTLFPGDEQTYYNSTVGTVTLSTPSGIFTGTGGPGTSTYSLPSGSVLSVTSNGTNYIVISEDGSPLTATSGSFSGDVTMNGGSATVSITPQTFTLNPGGGTINAVAIGGTARSSGAFTSLTANQATTLTGNIASSSTGTGTLVVTGGVGVSGQLTATNLGGTLQTAAQPNITSVGTLSSLSITNGGTVAGRYLHYQITREGAGNLGTHQGYLLLAKAYITGNQAISFVKGYFTMTRGSVTSGNKSDIFHVNSQSAYQSESLLVTGSTNGGFWSRTCKVTYGGVVYHAIETGAGGGEPDNGVFFTGEFTNCSPIYTDATFVTNVTAYGNSSLLNANDGSGWLASGNVPIGIGTTGPTLSSGIGLHINNSGGGHANVKLQSTARTWELLGTSGGYFSIYDTSGGADRLSIKTNGNVGIGTTDPQTKFNINYGAGSAAGDAVIRIGGTSNYASLELGIKGGYDGMIRTYGNDLHLYAGHWQGASTATENHYMYFYTSQNGSSNWSTPKMTLSNVGNLTITGTLTESSSITLKENLTPITGALNSVKQLVGQIYDRTDNLVKQEAGLIAEEVYKVLPNLVQLDEDGKPLGVKYTKIVAYLVESIKELSAQIEELKKK